VKTIIRIAILVAIGATTALLGACSTVGVEVWERDILAKSEMQPGYEAVDRALDDHVYFSKEASSGGRGLGGGGCGCN
jgi:hypothetical protein